MQTPRSKHEARKAKRLRMLIRGRELIVDSTRNEESPDLLLHEKWLS